MKLYVKYSTHAVYLYSAPSGPPQNVTLGVNDSRSITLNWNHPLPEDINGIILDYTINISYSNGVTSFQTGSNSTVYIVGSLQAFVAYTCVIAAHTSVGQGPFSNSITLTTPEDIPGAPPVMLAQANLQSRSVDLSWVSPIQNQLNGVLRSYRIEAYEINTGRTLVYQTLSTQTTFNLNSLHPYYEYTVRVSAVTVGPGPLSTAITVRTPQDGKLTNYM